MKQMNEEIKNESLWELYLHHTFLNESFEDFKDKVIIHEESESENKQPIEAIINQSKDMLVEFNPLE